MRIETILSIEVIFVIKSIFLLRLIYPLYKSFLIIPKIKAPDLTDLGLL